jgi:ABC-2 type transport system permease protein
MTLDTLLVISYRDLLKFLRDPMRLVWSFVFPLLLIGIFGGTMEANLGDSVGFNYLAFVFTGVFAYTLFMSASEGVISLIDDSESDFSQEVFVSPISRYTIVLGKIVGESLVALPRGLGILITGSVLGLSISPLMLLELIIVGALGTLLGASFGVMLLGNFNNRRIANQVVPFIVFPQLFLAGVITPIGVLPWYLEILSRISPMRYAVDLARGIYFGADALTVLASPASNLVVMAAMFANFLLVGTILFIRRERRL